MLFRSYADAAQRPWADNHLRFARLAWAAAELALGWDAGWQPEVVHAHDWHAGLVPACLRAVGARAGSLFTVHNLAYQGDFAAELFPALGLPAVYFQPEGLEFWGRLNFMKAGLYFADRLSTVSPRYAQEIQQPEQGMGLDGLLRARSGVLHGVLNGVDPAVWGPATDRLIPARYDAGQLAGKARCRTALREQLGLAASASGQIGRAHV